MTNDLIVEASRFMREDFCEPHVGKTVKTRGILLGFVGAPKSMDHPDSDVYAVYVTSEGRVRADAIVNVTVIGRELEA